LRGHRHTALLLLFGRRRHRIVLFQREFQLSQSDEEDCALLPIRDKGRGRQDERSLFFRQEDKQTTSGMVGYILSFGERQEQIKHTVQQRHVHPNPYTKMVIETNI
jgi:hypothetical protein